MYGVMRFRSIVCLVVGLLYSGMLWAQEPEKKQDDDEEEDFSQYAEFDEADDKAAKRFCTSKVLGLSPSKLISVGFDAQGPYELKTDLSDNEQLPGADAQVASNHGFRFAANTPLLSRTNILVNVGVTYMENRYTFERSGELVHPLHRALNRNGLRNTGLNLTVFKPFNQKNFMIVQAGADLSGDYALDAWQSPEYLRYTGALIYGWKPHDRKMIGFGLSRTYRAGALNYIPLLYLNYTYPERKWGAECLFPARANLRYTFNARNMVFAGYELEGQSYRLNNAGDFDPVPWLRNPELRRSELRIRLTYEVSLYNFLWLSVQGGYRYNWLFSVDDGDFFRSFFEDKPFAISNSIGNPLYFNVSINLVSP